MKLRRFRAVQGVFGTCFGWKFASYKNTFSSFTSAPGCIALGRIRRHCMIFVNEAAFLLSNMSFESNKPGSSCSCLSTIVHAAVVVLGFVIYMCVEWNRKRSPGFTLYPCCSAHIGASSGDERLKHKCFPSPHLPTYLR